MHLNDLDLTWASVKMRHRSHTFSNFHMEKWMIRRERPEGSPASKGLLQFDLWNLGGKARKWRCLTRFKSANLVSAFFWPQIQHLVMIAWCQFWISLIFWTHLGAQTPETKARGIESPEVDDGTGRL